jgi:hypothetical protein
MYWKTIAMHPAQTKTRQVATQTRTAAPSKNKQKREQSGYFNSNKPKMKQAAESRLIAQNQA